MMAVIILFYSIAAGLFKSPVSSKREVGVHFAGMSTVCLCSSDTHSISQPSISQLFSEGNVPFASHL